MAKVQIGEGDSAKIVEIGDENYQPTQADVEEVASSLGLTNGAEQSQEPAVESKDPLLARRPFVESVRDRILESIKSEPMRKYQELTGFVKGFTGSDPIKAINDVSKDVSGIKDAIVATVNRVHVDTKKTRGFEFPEQDETGKKAQTVGTAIATAAAAYAVANAAKAGLSKIDIQKGYKKVADESKKALDNVYKEFEGKYEKVIAPIATKPADTSALQAQILTSADNIPAGGTAEKYMGKLIDRLDNETVGGLHALKEEIYKTSKNYIGQERKALMDVYRKVNEVLSSPANAGDDYARLTAEYLDFASKEANYVKSKIMDKFGNATEERISKGLKSMQLNARDAFDRLNTRKTTGIDLIKEMKRLDTIKKVQGVAKGVGGKVLTAAGVAGAAALGMKAAK